MKVGIIGAGTMGQGIAKAFAQVEGYEVALCDIKQEWADAGKEKIKKGYARLVEKRKNDPGSSRRDRCKDHSRFKRKSVCRLRSYRRSCI